MPGWIIGAAVASIVITALLTFVLWRLNAPLLERAKRDDSGDVGYVAPIIVADSARNDRSDDGGSDDGGSGDAGGDGGGGGGGK